MANRRTFLKSLAGVTAGLSLVKPSFSNETLSDRLGEILPKRKLGKTGEFVTMLGTGGYHVGWTSERDAQEVVEAALEGGVRFFDTAEGYVSGVSEERYGKYLTPKYRDLIFLMTKTMGRDVKTVQEHLEGSLRRMKVDQIDLYQLHSLTSPEDVDGIIKAEVIEYLLKAKEEGKIKYLGFTGHQNPYAFTHMLDVTKGKNIFDTLQMPVNVLDQTYYSYIENVFPKALEQDIAVLAMKSLAAGRFFANKERFNWSTDNPVVPDHMSIKEAMYFVWSLPVAVLISGNENATFMREKIALARSFSKFSEEERLALVEKVKHIAATGQVEYYKQKES